MENLLSFPKDHTLKPEFLVVQGSMTCSYIVEAKHHSHTFSMATSVYTPYQCCWALELRIQGSACLKFAKEKCKYFHR